MPPTSAATKVKYPDYKNWIRVVMALYYLKVGLTSFIQNEVNDMHQYLLQTMYGGSGVPKPKCTICKSKDVKQNIYTHVWKFLSPCLSSLCDIWLKELLTLHTRRTSSNICFGNCDVTAWPFVPWECAKLYMPRGQPPANTGPAMSDSQALLILMANCKYFHGKFSQRGITLITKVSTIRNKVMHTGDMNLSDSDMKSSIQDIIDLLEDQTHLRSLEECKQAVNEINRINKDSVDIFNLDIEMMALRECVNDCRQELGVHEKTTAVTVESLKEELTKLMVQINTNAKETKDKIADLDVKYQQMDSSMKQMDSSMKQIDSSVKQMDSSVTILSKTVSSDLESLKKQLSEVNKAVEDVKATKTKQLVKVLKRNSDTDKDEHENKLRKLDKEVQKMKASTSRVTDYVSTEDVESGMEIHTAHSTAGEEQLCLKPSLKGTEYGLETDLAMDDIRTWKLEEETMKRDGNVLSDLREEEPVEIVSWLQESMKSMLEKLTRIETRITVIENQKVDRTELNQRIASVGAMSSPPASDTDRFMCIAYLLVHVGSRVLRQLLSHHAVTSTCTLDQYLAKNINTINSLRRVFNQPQMDIMFPPNGDDTNLDDYDITLLSALFQNIVPTLSQLEKDMIKRVREEKNKLYGHAKSCQISANDFQTYWNDISSILTTLSQQCMDIAFEAKILQEIQCTQVSAIPAGSYLDILKTWFGRIETLEGVLQNVTTRLQALDSRENSSASESYI